MFCARSIWPRREASRKRFVSWPTASVFNRRRIRRQDSSSSCSPNSAPIAASFCADIPAAFSTPPTARTGTKIVTASEDHTARIWDARTGLQLLPPLPQADDVLVAVFSPDGKRVATGCEDGTARIWDAATGQPIGDVMKETDAIKSVRFSPDGKLLATGADNNFARNLGRDHGEACPHDPLATTIRFFPSPSVPTAAKFSPQPGTAAPMFLRRVPESSCSPFGITTIFSPRFSAPMANAS